MFFLWELGYFNILGFVKPWSFKENFCEKNKTKLKHTFLFVRLAIVCNFRLFKIIFIHKQNGSGQNKLIGYAEKEVIKKIM